MDHDCPWAFPRPHQANCFLIGNDANSHSWVSLPPDFRDARSPAASRVPVARAPHVASSRARPRRSILERTRACARSPSFASRGRSPRETPGPRERPTTVSSRRLGIGNHPASSRRPRSTPAMPVFGASVQDACRQSGGGVPRVVSETVAWLDAHGAPPSDPAPSSRPASRSSPRRVRPRARHRIPRLPPEPPAPAISTPSRFQSSPAADFPSPAQPPSRARRAFSARAAIPPRRRSVARDTTAAPPPRSPTSRTLASWRTCSSST